MSHKPIRISRLTTPVSKNGLKLSHFRIQIKDYRTLFSPITSDWMKRHFSGAVASSGFIILVGSRPSRHPTRDPQRMQNWDVHNKNNNESESARRYIVQPPLTSTVDDSKVRSSDFIKILYHLIYVTYRMWHTPCRGANRWFERSKDSFHFGPMFQWLTLENCCLLYTSDAADE